MGCNGCPGKDKNDKFDKHGNVVGSPNKSEAAILGPPKEVQVSDHTDMSYADYKKAREEFRASSREMGNKKLKTLSDDYKRIQIDSLVAVYNHDDVDFKLTPTQALVALWEFAHHPEFQKVFDEFEGLREQVDKKYLELKNNDIVIKWKP